MTVRPSRKIAVVERLARVMECHSSFSLTAIDSDGATSQPQVQLSRESAMVSSSYDTDIGTADATVSSSAATSAMLLSTDSTALRVVSSLPNTK